MNFINDMVNNLDKIYPLLGKNNIHNLEDYDIPHINLYGPEGSMKKFYSYYIINKINNINLNSKDLNIKQDKILIKNNSIEFKLINNKYFKEINLFNKLNNEKNILKYYILETIKIRNITTKKHVFILTDFDKFSFNSFMLLRRIMESYTNNVLFIFVSTNLSKIPSAIKSRCLNIRCPILDYKILVKVLQFLTKKYFIEKKDLTKNIKKNEGDIYKILFDLENQLHYPDSNGFQNILHNDISKHLAYIKKEKNPIKLIENNRIFIFKLINFNFNNETILENFVEILIKKYSKYIDVNKIIKLTNDTNINIVKSYRELYHYELYLFNIYKLLQT